ncbi:MAG: hypothetical protein E6Q28_15750 [Afipia sp.]|nr:MAG: hypothetical protein E6Q28_15750 [Afipia sp.]
MLLSGIWRCGECLISRNYANSRAGNAVRHNDSNATGMSQQDRATVPGPLNVGGTSQSSPNTAQPGARKEGK